MEDPQDCIIYLCRFILFDIILFQALEPPVRTNQIPRQIPEQASIIRYLDIIVSHVLPKTYISKLRYAREHAESWLYRNYNISDDTAT